MNKKDLPITRYATIINQRYSVSMAYRPSSGMYGRWYYELYVYKGELVIYEMDAGPIFEDALKHHDRLVKIITYLETRRCRSENN